MNYYSMWGTNSHPFAIIAEFNFKNDKNQDHHRFFELSVFTRTNEPNEVIASSLLEDINFPLYGIVVVTCWDAEDASFPAKVILCEFSPWTYSRVQRHDVVYKKHDVCPEKLSREDLSKRSIKHQQTLKARYYFTLMSLQISCLWLELPQLRGLCRTGFFGQRKSTFRQGQCKGVWKYPLLSEYGTSILQVPISYYVVAFYLHYVYLSEFHKKQSVASIGMVVKYQRVQPRSMPSTQLQFSLLWIFLCLDFLTSFGW